MEDKFETVHDLICQIDDLIQEVVNKDMAYVSAKALGLDGRAGMVYINDDFVAVEGRSQSLDYYGGFDYVDDDYVISVGDFKFYSCEDDRVYGAIEHYNDSLESEESDTDG